jgi:hypothetical protein
MTIVHKEYDKDLGILTTVHDVEGKRTFQKTYDADPYLKHAEMMRQETQGMNWGIGKKVGTIPPAELGNLMRRDGGLSQESLEAWLKANPKFVCFDKFLKR